MSKEFDLQEYQKDVLNEVRNEYISHDGVAKRCRLASFVSRSAGKGKKRKERHVELLVVDETYAYVIKDNEIRSRKNQDRIAIDVLANEVLADEPYDERTTDKLLKRVRNIHRKT